MVTLAAMLELLDTSIVNVAIPHMMGNLGATLDEIAWVSTGYVVANVIVLPISGWLSNYFGRRNYYALSILIFTIASLFCGSATSLGELVFWRIVQGLGGGGLIATAHATLYETFSAKEISNAVAIFGVGVMVGPALGPTLGGWITDTYSWPWIFYINLPLGILTLFAALTLMPESPHRQRAAKVDWLGLLLLAAGIGCLQMLLERGERLDWFESREIVTYALVSSSALIFFAWHEWWHDHPIVNLHVLRDIQFSVALVFTFLVGVALFATVFVLPVYMQGLLAYNAWETGMVILPGALATGVSMVITGRIVSGSGYDLRWFVVAGACIFAGAMWMHGQFTIETGQSDFLLPTLLRGIGLGMVFVPLNNLALGNLAPQQIGNGSGIYNLTRQLGGSVGIALSATALVQLQNSNRGQLLHLITLDSAQTTERLAKLKSIFLSHGMTDFIAAKQALIMLNRQLEQQAAMLSYEYVFLCFGFALLSALPLLLLMKRTRFGRASK